MCFDSTEIMIILFAQYKIFHQKLRIWKETINYIPFEWLIKYSFAKNTLLFPTANTTTAAATPIATTWAGFPSAWTIIASPAFRATWMISLSVVIGHLLDQVRSLPNIDNTAITTHAMPPTTSTTVLKLQSDHEIPSPGILLERIVGLCHRSQYACDVV
jgi:hypothetical protein